MRKKCVFLIPYFGKFKNYFQLFLNSCKKNSDYTWIIITDNSDQYDYPTNVEKVEMSFDELKNKIQKKFEFKLSLDKPYKLCDFRPAYGYIFDDLIKDYEWWGHCDTDTIMGNLNDFITDKMLSEYDKLFCLGHLSMYKNTAQNNKLFMKEINGQSWYRESFTTDKPTNFDEVWGNNTNINTIFKHFSKRVYERDLSLNFNPEKLSRFKKQTYYYTTGKFIDEKNDRNKLAVWNQGKLFRYSLNSKRDLVFNEYMYLHLQNREMKMQEGILNVDLFDVIPNEFCLLDRKRLNAYSFMSIRKIQYKYKVFNVLQLDKLKTISIFLKRKLVKLKNLIVD